MRNPGDHVADDHVSDEYSPGNVLEPTAETLANFEKIVDELKNLREPEHSRFLHADIRDQQTGQELQVDCTILRAFRESGESDSSVIPELRLKTWSERQSPWKPGAEIDSRSKGSQDLETLEDIIPKLQKNMGDKDKTAWLGSVLETVRRNSQSEGYSVESITALLDSSPYKVRDMVTFDLTHIFENGSTTVGRIDPMADASPRDSRDSLEKLIPVRSVRLETTDGTSYAYTSYSNGETKLLIEKDIHRIPREVGYPEPNVDDEADGDLPSMNIDASPAIMQMLAASHEVARLKLDHPTEGNMRAFTKALRAALKSGVVPGDSPEAEGEDLQVHKSPERRLVSDVSFGDDVVSTVQFSGRPARVFEVNASDERPSVEVFLVKEDGGLGYAGGTIYFDQIDKVIPGNDTTIKETEKILAILTNDGAGPSETRE